MMFISAFVYLILVWRWFWFLFFFFFWHFVLDAFPTYYFDGEYPFCSIVFA